MQRIDGRLLFAPSDLNHFLECEHLIALELARDPAAPRGSRDPQAELLAEKGAEHERAWLGTVQGRRQARSSPSTHPARSATGSNDAERTIAAMRDGAEVIYQGVFADGDWHGISDFLVRVDRRRVWALGATRPGTPSSHGGRSRTSCCSSVSTPSSSRGSRA